MPVPTDQLAEDIRESDRRLTDAINDLGRKVDADRAELSEFRSEIGQKVDANQVEVNRRIDAGQAELNRRIDELGQKADANQAEVVRKFDVIQEEFGRKLDLTRDEFGRKLDLTRDEFGRKLDLTRDEFALFRAQVLEGQATLRVRFETALAVAKWSIGISVPLLITLLGFTASMIWNASRLETLVREHEEFFRAKKVTRGEVPKAIGSAPAPGAVAEHERAAGS
jgi:hypothetical protein